MRRQFPKLIRLLFLVLAGSTVVSLLVDLLTTSVIPRNLWIIQVFLLFLANSSAFRYLDKTARQVEEFSTEGRLPEWVLAQVEKNRSRSAKFFSIGFFAFFLVDVARRQEFIVDNLYVGFKSFSVAVQIGSFFGEYLILNAQMRLVRDVEAWVKKPDHLLAGSEV
jgi:hypothetical protein